MKMVSSFVLREQGQLSTPQSDSKGCPIGERRPRWWARGAKVIIEPTGASWIMLLQAKTAFSQDSLSACPPSKPAKCGNPSHLSFEGEEYQGRHRGGQSCHGRGDPIGS